MTSSQRDEAIQVSLGPGRSLPHGLHNREEEAQQFIKSWGRAFLAQEKEVLPEAS